MNNFIFTPENIKDPLNHPHRIYFSFHNDDKDNFDFVSQQIRKIENDCVIAYANPEGDELSRTLELENFHLTVAFITENWFKQGTHTHEFFHLVNKSKAILPILFNSSLEDRFNKSTNNMQFLLINDADFTEKLRRALQDILFDSKLIDDVNKVFTHKMFVSYCREDLEEARRLIRNIHKEEKGKRISIWYDKYLPMGKNFEDSIFAQLDDSNFFAVTLTPNLLNRENYVKTQEYPHAKSENKKIIFFEMTSVDKDNLINKWESSERYDYITLKNPKEFAEFIKTLVKNETGKSNDLTRPEIDYLLGLAYQNGLFVEFDHSYAARKFKAAANANHKDAAHALANMLYYGAGIKRNENEATVWYIKEVRIVEKEFLDEVEKLQKAKKVPLAILDPLMDNPVFAKDSTLDSINNIIKKIYDITNDLVVRCCNNARRLRDSGRIKKAEEIYRIALQSLDYIDSIANQLALGNKYRNRIENEMNVMLIVMGKADIAPIRKAWIDCLQKYNQDPENYLNIHGLLHSAHNYGALLLKQGLFSEARQIMNQALIAETKACEDGIIQDDRITFELVLVLHRDIGRSYIMEKPDSDKQLKNNINEALRMFNSVLFLMEDLPFSIDENLYLYFNLPRTFLCIGDTYLYAEDYKKALENYLLSLSEIKNLEEKLGDKANCDDFPVSILEIYTEWVKRTIQFNIDEVKLLVKKEIELLLKRYNNIKFVCEYEEIAKNYLQQLNNSLNYISEND